MSENKKNDKETTKNDKKQENLQPLIINGQFIKDFSFESPNSPAIFKELNQTPEVEVGVDVEASRINNNTFGVDIKFNIKGTVKDKVAFLIELVYSCVAQVNVEPQHIEPMLLIEIPRHMFPFARSIIAQATQDGGFPPLLITPIDFISLYRKKMENLEEKAKSKGEKEE